MHQLKVQRCSEALIALMGIWLIVGPLQSLMGWLFAFVMNRSQSPEDGLESSMIVAQTIAVLWSVLLGVILIKLRSRLARWLAPESSSSAISAQALMAVGTALLGVYFLVSGSVDVAIGVGIRRAGDMTLAPLTQTRHFWAAVANLIAGLGLFVFSASVARFWQLLRGRLAPEL